MERKESFFTKYQALGTDYWKFWLGQTISNLGNAITIFALPLLIYKLTNSAFNLALATAVNFLPYLLFGLIIGAWVDRADRKRLMIMTDIGRALVIASIPLVVSIGGDDAIWWIYVVGFINSTMGIAFNAAQFAVIPNLVSKEQLVTANGYVQAGYSGANVIGPFLAGLLITTLSTEVLLYGDSLTYIVSAISLVLVKTSLSVATDKNAQKNIRADIVEGLGYVLKDKVLLNISLMMALVNLVGTTRQAQLILFANDVYEATDAQVGLLYSAGSIGVVVLSLLAGYLHKKWSFSKVALGALMLNGLLTMLLAWIPIFWVGTILWAFIVGFGVLFNINTGSLRQTIVPKHMLGRVVTIAMVLAWSVNPFGTIIGGLLIESSGNINLIYMIIGLLVFLIAVAFSFTAFGHAEDYIPEDTTTPESEPVLG